MYIEAITQRIRNCSNHDVDIGSLQQCCIVDDTGMPNLANIRSNTLCFELERNSL